jgi:hypothetical protein
MLDEFQVLIGEAASGDHAKVQERNAKREQLMNLLTDLGNYVEGVANDEVNVALGPEFVIASAGMRAQPPGQGQPQQFKVKAGNLQGQIKATAESVAGKQGVHSWQWLPEAGGNWSENLYTSRADILFTNLERALIIVIRHRVVGSPEVTTDWEISDSIVVP